MHASFFRPRICDRVIDPPTPVQGGFKRQWASFVRELEGKGEYFGGAGRNYYPELFYGRIGVEVYAEIEPAALANTNR